MKLICLALVFLSLAACSHRFPYNPYLSDFCRHHGNAWADADGDIRSCSDTYASFKSGKPGAK